MPVADPDNPMGRSGWGGGGGGNSMWPLGRILYLGFFKGKLEGGPLGPP